MSMNNATPINKKCFLLGFKEVLSIVLDLPIDMLSGECEFTASSILKRLTNLY